MSLSERTRRREHRNPENLEAVARHISIERKKKKKKKRDKRKRNNVPSLCRARPSRYRKWTFTRLIPREEKKKSRRYVHRARSSSCPPPIASLFRAARAQIAGSTSAKQKRIFISPLSGFPSLSSSIFYFDKSRLRGFSRE